MPSVAAVELRIGTGNISMLPDVIEARMRNNLVFLGTGLVQLVRGVTPVLTGALQEDITWEPRSGKVLLWVYAAGGQQIMSWGREYVQYVEGPPLGKTTWTNPPRNIFLNTAQGSGLDFTYLWAVANAQAACDAVAALIGAP